MEGGLTHMAKGTGNLVLEVMDMEERDEEMSSADCAGGGLS
jgi:hypothetical protein